MNIGEGLVGAVFGLILIVTFVSLSGQLQDVDNFTNVRASTPEPNIINVNDSQSFNEHAKNKRFIQIRDNGITMTRDSRTGTYISKTFGSRTEPEKMTLEKVETNVSRDIKKISYEIERSDFFSLKNSTKITDVPLMGYTVKDLSGDDTEFYHYNFKVKMTSKIFDGFRQGLYSLDGGDVVYENGFLDKKRVFSENYDPVNVVSIHDTDGDGSSELVYQDGTGSGYINSIDLGDPFVGYFDYSTQLSDTASGNQDLITKCPYGCSYDAYDWDDDGIPEMPLRAGIEELTLTNTLDYDWTFDKNEPFEVKDTDADDVPEILGIDGGDCKVVDDVLKGTVISSSSECPDPSARDSSYRNSLEPAEVNELPRLESMVVATEPSGSAPTEGSEIPNNIVRIIILFTVILMIFVGVIASI